MPNSFSQPRAWTEALRLTILIFASPNKSGVFCTINAQAPSLFSNVTLTRRALLPETVSTYDQLRASAC